MNNSVTLPAMRIIRENIVVRRFMGALLFCAVLLEKAIIVARMPGIVKLVAAARWSGNRVDYLQFASARKNSTARYSPFLAVRHFVALTKFMPRK